MVFVGHFLKLKKGGIVNIKKSQNFHLNNEWVIACIYTNYFFFGHYGSFSF